MNTITRCIGGANDDPELFNYEEDTNAPEYSDTLDSESMDDIKMAKDQSDTTVEACFLYLPKEY